MNEMNLHSGSHCLIESLQNHVIGLRCKLDLAIKIEEKNLKIERIAQSILKNNTLGDIEKIEILEFLFLTNK
jgi:hypothetical protein